MLSSKHYAILRRAESEGVMRASDNRSVRELAGYEGKVFTGYNTDFDFGRFLRPEPWDFRPRLAPCIMVECADRFNGGCWMKAQDAYDMLCPGNPAGVPGGKEEHRALSDAVLEGYILLGLCSRDPDIRDGYVRAAEGSEC